MADGSGGGASSLLGVIIGAILVVVIGAGVFMYVGHHSAPSGPSINVTMPQTPSGK